MGVEKAIQNLKASATGNIVKAVLCIRAVKKQSIDQNDDKGIDALGDSIQSTVKDTNALNDSLMERAEASLNGDAVSTYKDIKSEAESNNYIALEVQYNPTSIRFDTSAGRQMNYGGEVGNVELKQFRAPASTTLTVELLFDDVDTADAFGLEDSPLAGISMANTLRSIANTSGKEHSVQHQMEGLLSLLTIPAARQVIFFWGNMSFRGEVCEVNETYTMFNSKGYPIRGKVMLQIRQASGMSMLDSDADAMYEYDETYWTKAFDETFKESDDLLNLKL